MTTKEPLIPLPLKGAEGGEEGAGTPLLLLGMALREGQKESAERSAAETKNHLLILTLSEIMSKFG